MVVFSEYVLHHISHDGSMIRWYILLWFSRKQNEYRVHLENQFLHLSFRSCTFSYSLPEGQVQKLVFFAYTSLIVILSTSFLVAGLNNLRHFLPEPGFNRDACWLFLINSTFSVGTGWQLCSFKINCQLPNLNFI